MSYTVKGDTAGMPTAMQGNPQSHPAVATTTTVTRQGETSASVLRTQSVSRVLGGFALTALLMGIAIFFMNVAVVGQGIEIYSAYSFSVSGAFSGALPRVALPSNQVNYYGGIWYGLVNIVLCVFSLVFCCKTITNSSKDAGYIHNGGCIRVAGALLSTFFGLSAVVGIGAVIVTAITTFALPTSSSNGCVNLAVIGQEECLCSLENLVIRGADCAYATGTLFQIYCTILAISAILVVLDIVIASLFCGALCCCAVRHAPYGQFENQHQTVVVTTSAPSQPAEDHQI